MEIKYLGDEQVWEGVSIDGDGDFVLTKNNESVVIWAAKNSPDLYLNNWTFFGCRRGSRLRATWQALKFIWGN